MALDFHRLDNNEFLFGLNDIQFTNLNDVFIIFTQRTGLVVDQDDDAKLTTENQQLLTKIIDKYISATDLNSNKNKISDILEFKGLLTYFLLHKIDLQLFED